MMALTPRAALGVAVIAIAVGPARAMTIQEAFEAARSFDPQYRAASHELASVRESLPIARAALLPQLSFQSSNVAVAGTRIFPNSSGQEVSTRVDYTAPSQTLQLRQPVFNGEGLMRYRQTERQIEAAEAGFRGRGLELVDRLTTAYMQALLTRGVLDQAQTEVLAIEAQLARSEARLARGEGTRIEVAQSSASLELARVRVLEVRDALRVATQRVVRVTGRPAQELRGVAENFRPPPLLPGSLDEWLSLAREQSPGLQARLLSVEVARQNVKRNWAGHLPRVDLVASLGRSSNDSISNLNQGSRTYSGGFQVTVPLFSGGAVSASVRQAESDLMRVEEEARNEQENLELDVRRLFLSVGNAVARVDAQAKVVEASEVALTGITRALEGGLATTADLLDARNRLFAARRDLTQARYDYLTARVRLLLVAGTPMQLVIDDLDRLLTERTEMMAIANP